MKKSNEISGDEKSSAAAAAAASPPNNNTATTPPHQHYHTSPDLSNLTRRTSRGGGYSSSGSGGGGGIYGNVGAATGAGKHAKHHSDGYAGYDPSPGGLSYGGGGSISSEAGGAYPSASSSSLPTSMMMSSSSNNKARRHGGGSGSTTTIPDHLMIPSVVPEGGENPYEYNNNNNNNNGVVYGGGGIREKKKKKAAMITTSDSTSTTMATTTTTREPMDIEFNPSNNNILAGGYSSSGAAASGDGGFPHHHSSGNTQHHRHHHHHHHSAPTTTHPAAASSRKKPPPPSSTTTTTPGDGSPPLTSSSPTPPPNTSSASAATASAIGTTDNTNTAPRLFGRPSGKSVSLVEDELPGSREGLESFPKSQQKPAAAAATTSNNSMEMDARMVQDFMSSVPGSSVRRPVTPTAIATTNTNHRIGVEQEQQHQQHHHQHQHHQHQQPYTMIAREPTSICTSGNKKPAAVVATIAPPPSSPSVVGSVVGAHAVQATHHYPTKPEEEEGVAAAGGVARRTELDYDTVEAKARELRRFCHNTNDNSEVAFSAVQLFVEECQRYQKQIEQATAAQVDQPGDEGDGGGLSIEQLFYLNDDVLHAIKTGQAWLHEQQKHKRMPISPAAVAEAIPAKPDDGHPDLEIAELVSKQDIFSLICMLRAPIFDRRLKAAVALMRFARSADERQQQAASASSPDSSTLSLSSPDGLALKGPTQSGYDDDKGSRDLRFEIQSSGGLHSLLTLFRTCGNIHELKVVVAMAVAYILPSVTKSSVQMKPVVGLRIMECLRFLSTARAVTPDNETITEADSFRAAAMGVTTFWYDQLEPMLRSQDNEELQTASRSVPFGRSASTVMRVRCGRSSGVHVFDQRQEALGMCELLEMTVELIVSIAQAVGETKGVDDAKAVLLVEQVCAVQVARSIAVRRGILQVLVDWIRTGDPEKIRPATTALSNLTSIEDQYVAGWIHSQLVKEDALPAIAALTRHLSLSRPVRLAIAQILSSLCVAPHTRAAVAEANFIHFLVNTLFQYSESEEVALFGGQALVQLAAGAITRANVFGAEDSELMGFATPDKQDKIVEDIVATGAIGQLVDIAKKPTGELQSVAIEAIRVLSEDLSPIRQTRLHLCEHEASVALGRALKDGVAKLQERLERLAEEISTTQGEANGKQAGEAVVTTLTDGDTKSPPPVSQSKSNITIRPSQRNIQQLHESLCALANILDPIQDANPVTSQRSRLVSGPKQQLINGCLQTVESGGLESLLWISSLPLKPSFDCGFSTIDLLQESCRSLGSISPLLLSNEFATRGYSRWADHVLLVFHQLLKQLMALDEHDKIVEMTDLHVSVLQGLGALAKSAPLKTRIIDRFLPFLIQSKTIRDRSNVSNAASQAFQSLEFAEDEVAAQVAGSNASMYADWFCLQRSILIQSLVRDEIRRIVFRSWDLPFSEVKAGSKTELIREISDKSQGDDGDSTVSLFDNFANDAVSADDTSKILRQYRDTYQGGESQSSIVLPDIFNRLSIVDDDRKSGDEEKEGLLHTQMYPLNNSTSETAWMLDHQRFLDESEEGIGLGCLPTHVEKFLDCCFPSRLLRDHVLPVKALRPDASFNFRALMMPQRRYFSFRREGQLLSRLWDKEDSTPNPSDVHCTLGFTNSSFAGEFAESLVQVLYLCPMICGLSFVQNAEFLAKRDCEEDNNNNNTNDGGSLLANLAGSLPTWISHLTFDGLLNDRDLKTLVKILDTMGKLSAGNEENPQSDKKPDRTASQVQGRFWFVAVRRSLDVSSTAWRSFFGLLGKESTKPGGFLRPLSTLKSLDLSGNGLGDELCAKLLGLIHDKDSGCSLEQLDLSGNNIGDGTNVVRALTGYVQYHRADLLGGTRKSWTAPLKTLRLSSNELHRGKAWFEILVLLKNNALALKVLDVSDNGISLEEDESEILGSSLLSNTCLCHLDLSMNKISAAAIDRLLEQLNRAKTDLGLAFLDFNNNEPPLNSSQLQNLRVFYRTSRVVAIERFLVEKEQEDDVPEPGLSPFPDSLGMSTLTLDSTDPGVSTRFLCPNGDNMITVLFSAPLVFEDTQHVLRPFEKLDFEMERELMWQCLKEASRDIHLRFDTATILRLQASMAQRCSCLHYSGHGHQQFLPFEDGKGSPHWVKVEEIKRLIAGRSGVPFRFVFVSACYSGLVGESFAAAGVPHVVCCQQQFELKDAAALHFTRQFYLALAVGNTVKESFDLGCNAVRAAPGIQDAAREMEKFMLLPKDGNHDVRIFDAKPVVEWPRVQNQFAKTRRGGSRTRASIVGARGSELSVRNMMQENPSPSPPHFFSGREVDMYHVLNYVLEKRLVSVLGEDGVGRSSMVCALCRYINERASTITHIDHIYYVKAKQVKKKNRVRAVILKLLKRLVEAGKASPLPPDGDVDLETLFDVICESLRKEKALIVFDRTEYLNESDEGNEFPMLLSNLFLNTTNVRVLMTARCPLGMASIGGQVEQHYELGPLSFVETVRLFACLCPYINPVQRRQLEAQLVVDKGEAELLSTDPNLSEEMKKTFALLGQGIPAKIEESASSISKDDVLEMLRGRTASS